MTPTPEQNRRYYLKHRERIKAMHRRMRNVDIYQSLPADAPRSKKFYILREIDDANRILSHYGYTPIMTEEIENFNEIEEEVEDRTHAECIEVRESLEEELISKENALAQEKQKYLEQREILQEKIIEAEEYKKNFTMLYNWMRANRLVKYYNKGVYIDFKARYVLNCAFGEMENDEE